MWGGARMRWLRRFGFGVRQNNSLPPPLNPPEFDVARAYGLAWWWLERRYLGITDTWIDEVDDIIQDCVIKMWKYSGLTEVTGYRIKLCRSAFSAHLSKKDTWRKRLNLTGDLEALERILAGDEEQLDQERSGY